MGLFRNLDRDVATVLDPKADLAKFLMKPPDAYGGRAHIHSSAPGPQVHGDPDDLDTFSFHKNRGSGQQVAG